MTVAPSALAFARAMKVRLAPAGRPLHDRPQPVASTGRKRECRFMLPSNTLPSAGPCPVGAFPKKVTEVSPLEPNANWPMLVTEFPIVTVVRALS